MKDNHQQHQPPPAKGAIVGVGSYKSSGAAAAGATIHIPLSGNKAGSNGTGAACVVPPEVNRTTVWQQINKDGISEQLIIPVTVKVRQINGNQ